MVLNNAPVKYVEILLSSLPLSAYCRPWPAEAVLRAMLYSVGVPVCHRVELMARAFGKAEVEWIKNYSCLESHVTQKMSICFGVAGRWVGGEKSEIGKWKLESGKRKTYRNCRASKPETRSGEDRVGLPKAAPEGRALPEQASSNRARIDCRSRSRE